ncbi:uncharacterized protein LOC125382162 [Haliotis rufescens]|uniref:uncharacterized protein LOC125382162 n=1 Tax=Haliotis rufescens TaxID=6454 RepID=UPI00201EE4EF|nr:uncharacterized protein LOC125382162 [Haliotis rufescens]
MFPTSKALRLHKNRTGHDMWGGSKGKLSRKKTATVSAHPSNPSLPPIPSQPGTPSNPEPVGDTSDHARPCTSESLGGDVREYEFKGQGATDALHFMVNQQAVIIDVIKTELREKQSVKWGLCLHIRMVKPTEDETANIHEAYFRSTMVIATQGTNLSDQYLEAMHKILRSLDNYQGEHSNLNVLDIAMMKVIMVKFKPFKGGTYIPLPKEIAYKTKSVVNVENNDEMCFIYSILAKLFPAPHHPTRVKHYQPFVNRLNLDGFTFPMTLKQIPRFEQVNQLSINVYGFEDKTLYPLYISNVSNIEPDSQIDLLMLSQENEPEDFEGFLGLEGHELMDVETKADTHFCLITKLKIFVKNPEKKRSNQYYICRKCLWTYSSQERLNKHKGYCFDKAQRVNMPKPEKAVYQFGLRSEAKTERAKFLIVADFESLLLPVENHASRLNRHVPCAYAYKVICSEQRYSKSVQTYVGSDAAEHFIQDILREYDEIKEIFANVVPMQLSHQDRTTIANTTQCGLCGKELGKDRVLDHDHLSGAFRQVLHNKCNLNFQLQKKVYLMLHNSERYDTHLILEAAREFGERSIQIIPHNSEQFLSFTVDNDLVFLDSCKFLQSSLDALTKNQMNKGLDTFVFLKEQFPQHVGIMTRKLPFPYEYMDSWEKLNDTQLPPKESFYSSLSDEGITDEDYVFAHELWHTFACNTMSDFTRLYVVVDTLLLADIVETFRTGCLADYGLDICHYYSMPGFCIDAALKVTGVKLDLFTDVDSYNFVENSIRGGVSVIGKKFAESNNEYMSNYNPEKEASVLLYMDFNSLYSGVMLEPLPIGNYQFMSAQDYETIDWVTIDTQGDTGYILEVDLHYPKHLHKLHAAFPMAPTHDNIPFEDFSPYHKELLSQFYTSQCQKPSGKKLFATLKDRLNYVVHFKTLQLYLRHGLVLQHIHRVLKFKQGPWLKPYVQLNLESRKHATDACDKDRYKLMNNCVFGRFCMNKRKRKSVHLVTQRQQFRSYVAKTNFKQVKVFSEDVVSVEMEQVSVHLDQPIAVGFSILDLAKFQILSFYYDVMQQQYGPERLDLLMTDTDSLFLHIHAPPHETLLDPYIFMKQNLHLFDTSNYDQNDPKGLYSNENKKVTGKMKDEAAGKIILEFVGLKSKMYSFLIQSDENTVSNQKTAKGIKKSVIAKQLTHKKYKDSLLERKPFYCSYSLIRSHNNTLYTESLSKIALSPLDDKRYVLEDGIYSLPYGYSPV